MKSTIINEDSELIRKKLTDVYFSIVDVQYGIREPPASYLIHQQRIGRIKRQNIDNQKQSNMTHYNFQKHETVNPLAKIKQFYCDPRGNTMSELGLAKKELPKSPELLKLISGDIVILFPIDMLTTEDVGIYFTGVNTFKMYDTVKIHTIHSMLSLSQQKEIKRTIYCSIVGENKDTLRITTVLNGCHHDKGSNIPNHKFQILDMCENFRIPSDDIDWLKLFTEGKYRP